MLRSAKNISALALVALFAAAFGCGVSAADPSVDHAAEPQTTPITRSNLAETSTSLEPVPTVQPPSSSVAEIGQRSTSTAVQSVTVPMTAYVVAAGSTAAASSTGLDADTASGLTSGQPDQVVNTMFGPIACDDSVGDVVLTHHVYDPSMFDTLVPMGRMWDSHVTPTDHLYFYLDGQRERGFVSTPAAGQIVHIQRFPNDQSPQWDRSLMEPDIRVVVAHSCTLFSVYIHLGQLVPEITEVTGELTLGESWFASPDTVIELDAGDAIARFGGSSIDYSLHDQTVTLAGFQVPEHYAGEPWKVHTVDPFDYLAGDLAEELQARNERTVEPFGGRIDYDVRGTLAGNWFMDGTVDYGGNGADRNGRYWNGHLSLAYDHIDPSQIRISIGRDIGITQDDCRSCGGVYAVAGNSPDPAMVTVSDGLIRYELTGRRHASPDSSEITVSDGNVLGTFLAQVIDDSIIMTEFFRSIDADEVSGFTSAAVLYRR